ncbi:c-type cytochrome [Pelagibacterium sp.]|uniref:c-type cytochrome n=1 Tax=Pelagibacterium sp. TaxID=1967288 RepID=UPI003BAB46F1
MRRAITIAIVVALAAIVFVVAWVVADRGIGTADRTDRLAEGLEIYRQNCAACHGEALEGQPDWRRRGPNGRMPAPPHDETGHTWHHGDEQLFRITRDGVAAVVGGNYESDMPGFGEILTDDEILSVLDYIKSTWPERERAYQAQVSAQDQ